ncbi:MAG: TonB-dependent receptor [Comamonadaceae bacterium]
MKKHFISVAVAIVCPFVFSAHAEGIGSSDVSPPDAAPALDTVVVSASRSQARVEQMPLHTTIVSREDIEKSAAQTLDQLLRDVPGLNFSGVPSTQSDPTGHSAKMRGMGNAKVLVLLDGVPIMDPFYLTTQWFKVPLSNIERVEVVRGGNSSLWGNMAVAGVINIVSKRAKDSAGEVGFSVGSHGASKLALSKNFVASDGLSFNLALDQFNARGYDPATPDQVWRFPGKVPANARDTNVQLMAQFKPTPELSGYLRIGYHIQDQDISYQFGNNLQKSPDLSASLSQKLGDKSTLTGTAWAQYVNFEKFNGAACYWQASAATKCPNLASASFTQLPAFVDDIEQYYTQYGSQRYREQGGSAIYSKNIGGLWRSLQVGMDYRHLAATDLEFFYGAPTSLAKLQDWRGNWASSTYGQADQTFAGLFAQTSMTPTPALELTLSARYDRWNNTDRSNTRTLAGAGASGGAQPDTSKSGLNPSLAGRYSINDDLALRAASYKSFRAPGFNNTTRTYGSPNPTIANPDLGPENLTGREIGADYSIGGLSVAATYFRYDISNMIATYKVTPANAPPLVQTICGTSFVNCGGVNGSASFYTNDQDGESNGIELTANLDVTSHLRLNGAYTRTNTVLKRKGYVSADPIDVQLAGIPRNIANVGITWSPDSKLRTNLQARYIGSLFIDTTSTAGTTYEQGGTTVLDISAQLAVSKELDLSLSVANLFDREYSENAYAYNQPWSRTLSLPRTLTVGMKYRF